VLRALTNAPEWEPPQPEGTVTELDRAIDILVEMKNISEVAVGLAYSALVFRDRGLATEVNHLEDRLDQMRERLETWSLRAAVRRGGRYFYRPRPEVVLCPGDELIATGPDEGHGLLAERCGYHLMSDDETGEDHLVPAHS